jgi:alkanesulfonate monooxygenase SsuD/methylene tetrahydromethanopterin reductase-like flavin-dependent oxidoreductase (luciferase family)
MTLDLPCQRPGVSEPSERASGRERDALMRVSLCIDPGRSWPQVLALARQVDLAGWHAVYVCDHFMPHDAAGLASDGPMLECWTVLAALATQTAAVRLGSLVLGNTYRHPAVVANMAATLDQVSQGRLVLGIGAGWQPNEHAAYGIPLPSARNRIAALDEACAVIRSLLDQQRSTLDGAVYRLRDAPCDPKPRSRLPVLVGGAGQGILRVAARHADVWHTWADPGQFAAKNAMLDALCRDISRRPGDVARACGGAVTVRTGRASTLADGDVEGTPQAVLSQLLAFRDAGATEYIVRDDAHVPAEQALTQIDILTNTVLPRLTPQSSGHPSVP